MQVAILYSEGSALSSFPSVDVHMYTRITRSLAYEYTRVIIVIY